MNILITIIAFIFVFGLLVFVHELGHFLAAKWMDVKVNSFAFGFPPTLLSKKVGETTYKLNAIPLGGYVAMQGELETEEEKVNDKDPRSLSNKQPWQVITIMIAGVVMNVILSIILFWFLYLVGFQPIMPDMANHTGIKNEMKLTIDSVEKDSPAEKAGLLADDTIISANGTKIYSSSALIEVVTSKGAEGVKLSVLRGGSTTEKTIVPTKTKVKAGDGKETEVYRLGVVLATKGNIHGDVISSFTAAVSEVSRITALTFESVIGLFRQLLFQFHISEDVSGPVGIVVLTNYFAQLGIIPLLQFAAILSLSLAIFNLLPIPALDGGQIFVTAIEMFMRRKFSTKTKNTIQLVGFAFIIGLFLIITVKDFVSFGIISYITGLFK